ncbi:hypothetical protein ACQ86B_17525 [Mycolicibacterium aichiense]|uniref:hypothetical protein n=1 Tax=Mycolicibacterium aichiense TaxID=1799 RepID=UPI003D67CA93
MDDQCLSPPIDADKSTMQRYFANQAAEMIERLPAECWKLGQPPAVHLALLQAFW